MALLRGLSCLLAAFLLAGPALGQIDLDGRKPPKPTKKRRTIRLDTSKAKAAPVTRADAVSVPVGTGTLPDWMVDGARPDLVLREVAAVRRRGRSPLLDRAAAILRAAGPEADGPLRMALASRHGPSVELAAEVIAVRATASGQATGAATLLRDALMDGVPTASARACLDAFASLSPSPPWVDLLASRSPTVRRRAAARLAESGAAEASSALIRLATGASASDTRHHAVVLLGRVPGRAADDALMAALGDVSAKVRGDASLGLGTRAGSDPTLALRLLDHVRAGGLDGAWAYGLLALCRAQDITGMLRLEETDVPRLLGALEVGDPTVGGAVAVALAGLGHRMSAAHAPWLDREVPHALVAACSGRVLGPDMRQVAPAARAALLLVSGLDDDPRRDWVAWWLASEGGFEAQRSTLVLGDPARLAVELTDPAGGSVVLAGRLGTARSEPLVLETNAAAALSARLEAWGILDALPSAEGSTVTTRLTVRSGPRVKRLSWGLADAPSWASELSAELGRLARERAWQGFRNPRRHASRDTFLAEEGPWWSTASRSDQERAHRLRSLVLGALPFLPLDRWEAGLGVLADQCDLPVDFGSDQARRLLPLVRAGSARTRHLALTIALRARRDTTLLADCLAAARGSQPLVALVAEACEAAGLAVLLADEDPGVRLAAVRECRGRGTQVTPETLLALLRDDSPLGRQAAAGLARGPRDRSPVPAGD